MDDERHMDDEAAPPAAEPQEPAADGIDEERLRAALEELRRLRVEDLAQEMMVTLVTVGYQKLGLTAQTRDLRDLGDARLAIELLRACVDTLARERGEAGLDALRSTLDAMQLDYAGTVMAGEGSAAATTGPAGADPPAAEAEEAPAAGDAPAEQEPPVEGGAEA